MDKALKQRLVGASVIIALAVVVLPMVFSGRPDGGAPESQKIVLPPRPGELSFETRKFPVGEKPGSSEPQGDGEEIQATRSPPAVAVSPDSPPEAETQPHSAVQEGPQTSPGATVTPPASALPDEPGDSREQNSAPESVIESETQEAVGKEPKGATAPTNSGRYLVQVASLGSAENAGILMRSLQNMGYPVLMDAVNSDVGKLNRVRVGPYSSETEAALVSARIEKEFEGVSPRTIDLAPEQTAAVTNPADPLVRWVVQIGSFAEAGNAERLVEQLRADGMSAYRDQVISPSASTYRVRVGPFLEREEAMRARQRLSTDFSMDGVV
ncbi:MAG: SPOR domain-containing protein, partial [Lysobacterales bacterium]